MFHDDDEVWKRYAPTVDTTLDFYLLSMPEDKFLFDQITDFVVQYKLFTFVDVKRKKVKKI